MCHGLPNYRITLLELGYTREADFANGCNDRLVDDIVAWVEMWPPSKPASRSISTTL
jgi:hypothetical protein